MLSSVLNQCGQYKKKIKPNMSGIHNEYVHWTQLLRMALHNTLRLDAADNDIIDNEKKHRPKKDNNATKATAHTPIYLFACNLVSI